MSLSPHHCPNIHARNIRPRKSTANFYISTHNFVKLWSPFLFQLPMLPRSVLYSDINVSFDWHIRIFYPQTYFTFQLGRSKREMFLLFIFSESLDSHILKTNSFLQGNMVRLLPCSCALFMCEDNELLNRKVTSCSKMYLAELLSDVWLYRKFIHISVREHQLEAGCINLIFSAHLLVLPGSSSWVTN